MAKRGKEGKGFPVTVGNLGTQPFTSAAPAVGAGHIGFRPSLVDENETPGINAILIAPPLFPPTGHVASILLAGQHAFF